MNTMNRIPSGYKQTEVGVIPVAWDVKSLGDIGILSKGKGLLKEDIKTNGTVPAIPYTALYTDFSEVLDYGLIKWFVDDTTQTVILSEPCVLIASSSNMAENTGKASALIGNTPVAIGREVIVFRTTSSSSYISYLLSTYFYRKRTLVLARGTTIKHLYPATFIDYKISLPQLPEQRSIATALSDVDALLAAQDKFIAKKRDIKQAAMQQLLTGKQRLPGFSGEWKVKRLGDVVEIRKGQLITEKDAIAGNVPVIAGGKKPAYYHNKPNRTGKTITVSASGASAGYVAFFDLPIFASDCSTIGEGSSYSIEFIYFQLQLKQEAIYKAQTGGAQPHIHAVDLMPLEIGNPRMAEQIAIAAVLSDMDTDLAALEQQRDKTRALKQGMMQALLTGRIRLQLKDDSNG